MIKAMRMLGFSNGLSIFTLKTTDILLLIILHPLKSHFNESSTHSKLKSRKYEEEKINQKIMNQKTISKYLQKT